MINTLVDWFATLQGWLFQSVVEPFVSYSGLGEFTEQAFEGTEWFLIGVCEIALIYIVLRPLEVIMPAQAITDRSARWNDFIYTVIHRLGTFAIVMFFVLDPVMDRIMGVLHLHGIRQFNLENVWPGVTDHPLISFMLYLVVLDFFDYWYHRGAHHIGWWWGLHSLHHSQQNMNLWSDNRNHLLDDFLRDIYMAVIALGIGMQPGQYVLLIAASRMLQSLQHANVRLGFGSIGERLLVSPRYHRLHHAIGIGHESRGEGSRGGHNFAVLFPAWDIVFGTAHFGKTFEATGIRDQLPPPAGKGRNYGRGFWQQQWLGLKRMLEFARISGS
jgi:sterol desaturase/sphingolipid hydroxylase (fatty acid hydroxylase superfamily)